MPVSGILADGKVPHAHAARFCAGAFLGSRIHSGGIAGREEKCRYVVEELGFDACISRLSPSFAQDLKAACPDGIDIYFENVGGVVFEAVLPLFNPGARMTICGLIAHYGDAPGADA